jgi:two-component system, OmpR family, copper resistance phosphate regulon response regulator CusR
MKVLIVEDEARIASFLVKGFTARGHGVEHVSTGCDGLARLRSDADFDVVLLDLGLPDVDGLDVLRDIRGRGLHTPVIILTARSADREAGLRLGADEFLVKPLPFARLLEHVQASADGVRAERPEREH